MRQGGAEDGTHSHRRQKRDAGLIAHELQRCLPHSSSRSMLGEGLLDHQTQLTHCAPGIVFKYCCAPRLIKHEPQLKIHWAPLKLGPRQIFRHGSKCTIQSRFEETPETSS